MGNAISEVGGPGVAVRPGGSPAEVQRMIEAGILPARRARAGVQRVGVCGAGALSLWVQPDMSALRRHGVGMDALVQALRSQVVLGPAGRLVLGHQDLLIEARSLPLTADAIRRVPVSTPEGNVPLQELARVVRAAQPTHSALELDGKPSVALVVFKQPDASTVSITESVAATLQKLTGQLPAGARWQRVYDQGHIVSLIRSDLGRNLAIGGGLAVAVLFWVLGGYPGVWLLALSIPLALLAGIGELYAAGHTLNLLTLGALTVAVGLLADDGIIVIEAVYRRWEEGMGRREGLWRGLRDIAAPDISGTLTTVATYLPRIAVTGLAGLFFVPFALALSFVRLAALVMSLTLGPLVACGWGARRKAALPGGARFLEALRQLNGRLLDWTISHARLSLAVAIVLLAGSVGALYLVPANLIPLPNEGVLLDSFTLPPGTSLDQTRATVADISRRLRADPAVDHTLARIGSAGVTAYTERAFAGELQLVLKPGTAASTLDSLSARLTRVAHTVGVQQSINTPTLERFGESLSGLPQPFVIELYGEQLSTLRRLSGQIVNRLRRVHALSAVFNNDAYPVTELRITPKPRAMRAYGLTPEALYGQLRPALRGEVIARMPNGVYRLGLYLRRADAEQLSLDELGGTLIRTANGWTPLRLLASLDMKTVPNQIRHVDGARALDILATPAGSVGGAMSAAEQALANVKLPPGYRVAFTGLDVELEHAAVTVGLAAVVALLLMLGILIFHFGGLRRPLILLLQVPLAFTGGALALAISGVGLNAIALVGFLTLIGIGLNHGIVLLHRAREAERDGLSPEAAVREAVRIRFRPIALTTLTAVLGMLPTALGWGAGAAPEQGLAVVILGGILWSSILSTNLLPALYLHWHRS